MSTSPSPPPFTFTPLNHDALAVVAVGALTPEQVAAITAPLDPNKGVKAVATLQQFDVSVDLSGVLLPPRWRVLVYVYVIGAASKYAALSYLPVPTKPLKTTLWRLKVGGVDDADTLAVSLPEPAKVARLQVAVRGLWTPPLVYAPTEP